MRILFLGAGGVGGYFGGRLAQAGADVTFLVRPKRADQLADGLKIQSPKGDATIPVKVITEDAAAGPFDIIALTCKAYGLAGALESIAPHVRPGTVIVPFLNGLTHVSTIAARFPEAIVWGGVAQIPAQLAEDGTVLHMAPVAGMIVGPREGQEATRPLAEALVSALDAAGIKATLTDQPMQQLWNKWAFLATLAGATCLMRADCGTIVATDYGRAFIDRLLAECSAVATAEGYQPSQELLDSWSDVFAPGSKWTASMLRDLQAGGPTEADHIIGEMIRLSERHGIETPNLEAAYTHLQVYEAGRTG